MRPAAVVLLLLPLLAACGEQAPTAAPAAVRSPAPPASAAPSAPAPADAAALLAAIPARAQAAGTVRYASTTVGAVGREDGSVQGRLAGVLDLTSGAGTGELELPDLADLADEAAAAGEPEARADLQAMARLALSWTPTDLTVLVDGERHTASRTDGDTGVVGRVPAEPAGLLDAAAAATDATVVGREDVGGVATTRVSGTVEPRAAVAAGLGTQAQLSTAALPALPVDVWLDGGGRPARIRFTADVPSLRGRTRTLTTTYDYRGWGEPVDVAP